MWKFIKSANKKDSWLDSQNSEILFWGRSNVGKSSLLNALANSKIAKVSSTPGRTKLINYFSTDNNKIIVDLPGYGYAKISKIEEKNISNMIENYFYERKNIEYINILIDSRISLTAIDIDMINLCLNLNHKVNLIVTKIDKSNQKQLNKTKKDIQTYYPFLNVFYISSKTKKNLDKLKLYYAV
ncbi:ribosome biogenesis GTP-binding protein YihA/YsxC [Mycoplasma miroungirhinis]|uniref:Probable GTP-binding protein EngB n=1 Tax=Mycoplasma miroungirhinis TaxID=754516 RepID=A0A6M4JBS5_9MOLU|nr:ribosome biogenesis GTP-binding protein YihA/YsxC [Mycoplasma miroungirhinis]QJR44414.1 YihA family ribosome biogenesis GTP-binding protein [Mycoplasma miroungirhinis]